MKKSETIGKLAEALAKSQQEFAPAPFDATNPFFKSKYATLTAIIEAAQPAFKNGLSVTQGIEILEGRVIVSTMLMHISGEWVETVISMKPKTDGPQDIGSAGTYGRRYALAAILGLCSIEDDDGNQAQGEPAKNKTTSQAKPKPQEKPPETVQGSTQNPPKDKTPAPSNNSGSAVAEEIKKIRELAQKAGVKNLAEGMEMVSAYIGRQVSALTELSAEERTKTLAEFGKLLEVRNG